MVKDKVLSIRLKDEQFDTLHKLSERIDTPKSKFVRSVLVSHLKAADNGEKVIDVKLKPSNYNILKEMAMKEDIKPEKFLRKLVKENLESPRGILMGNRGGISDEAYRSLEKEYTELNTLYQEVLKKNRQLLNENQELQSTIDTLTSLKNDFLEQLLFLMKFFQSNAKLLQQHDREFILQNKEKFAMIAKQLEGEK